MGCVSAADDVSDADVISDASVTTDVDTVTDIAEPESDDISDPIIDDLDSADLEDQLDEITDEDSLNPKNELKANAVGAGETGTFTDLYNLIQSSNTVNLNMDIVYNPSTDGEGSNIDHGLHVWPHLTDYDAYYIELNKNIVINGNGHTIDGKNIAGLFRLESARTITLNNLNIVNCVAQRTSLTSNTYYGGVINAQDYATTITINNCNFTNNIADVSGSGRAGVVYSTGNAKIDIKNSNFNNNRAYNGGVAYASNADITVVNSNFTSNSATTNGGVFYMSNNVLNVTSSTFKHNSANQGGVVYTSGSRNDNSNTVLGSSIFESNTATTNGGVVYLSNQYANADMHYDVFVNNAANVGTVLAYASLNSRILTEDDWWGTNKWNKNFINSTDSIPLMPDRRYLLTLTQTDSESATLTLELEDGSTPTGNLPLRDAAITITSGTVTPNATKVPKSIKIDYNITQDSTITATVDNQVLTLDVFFFKKDIETLTATVDDAILPTVPTLHVTASVDGDYDVVVGSKTYTVTVTDGEGSVALTGLDEGSYVAIVSRTNDPVYNDKFTFDSFNVAKDNVTITVSAIPTEIEYGDTITLSSTLNNTQATLGTTTYYIDGTETGTTLNLAVGEYTVIARYTGDPNFNDAESEPVTIKVIKATPIISVTASPIEYPADAVINFALTNSNNAALPGVTLRVKINGITYAVLTDANGEYSLTVSGLNAGEYGIEAISVADDNYKSATNDTEKIIVEKATITVSGEGTTVVYPDTGSITVTTDVAGSYSIKIGTVIYSQYLNAGENTVLISSIYDVDEYDITISANIDNYVPISAQSIGTYKVIAGNFDVYLNYETVVQDIEPVTIGIEADELDGNATIVITGIDIDYSQTIEDVQITDGSGQYALSNLPVGRYEVKVTVEVEGFNSKTVTGPELKIVPKKGTYTDLQYQVDNAVERTLDLSYDFEYDSAYDGDNFPNGVIISIPADFYDFYFTINGNDHTICGKELKRIFYMNENVGLKLNDLTLCHGNSDEGSAVFVGTGSLLQANNVTFDSNKASFNGGAVAAVGSLSLRDCVFTNNSAAANGGAVYSEVALDVTGTVFDSNDLYGHPSTGENGGSAIYSLGTLKIRDSTVTNNNPSYLSGDMVSGALAAYGDTYISNVTFANNKGYWGGAIAAYGGDGALQIFDSRFDQNAAEEGGAIFTQVKSISVERSNFTSNTATDGGAIIHDSQNILGMETVISNSIFDGNIVSGFGSAILASSGFEYKNCNFTNNYAPGGISVVYYRHDSTSNSDENYYDSSITSCRFDGNTAFADGVVLFFGSKALNVVESNFTSNVGRALSFKGSNLIVDKSVFKENNGHDGAIYLCSDAIIKNSLFEGNIGTEKIFNIFMDEGVEVSLIKNTFKKIAPTITTDKLTYSYDEDIQVSGNFDWGVSGFEIALPVKNGEYSYGLLDFQSGDFSFTIDDALSPGTYTLSIASFSDADENEYVVEENACTFQVGKLGTQIESEDITVYATVAKDIEFTLKDANGNILAGKTITVAFNGETKNLTTDENGVAKLEINMANKGTYSISASFAGDDDYESTFAAFNVIVKAKATKLTVSDASFSLSSSKYVTATLTAGGVPLANKIVTFSLNGKTYSGRTNADGVVKVSVSLTAKKTYSVVATFNGDTSYGSAVATYKLKVTS